MSERANIQAHCNKCLGETNHDIVHVEKEDWVDDLGYGIVVEGTNKYSMLKCRGCGSVTLRHSAWDTSATDENGRPEVSTAYYPPPLARRKPKWLRELEFDPQTKVETLVAAILKEVYAALQNDSRRLAAMGIRSLLDGIMTAQVGDQGTFAKSLDKFEEKGHVSTRQKATLITILDAGHAAIHRRYNPSAQDVETLMDVAESVVESVYVHSRKAKALKARVPRRARKKRSKGAVAKMP